MIEIGDLIKSNEVYSHILVAGETDVMDILNNILNKLEGGGIFIAFSP